MVRLHHVVLRTRHVDRLSLIIDTVEVPVRRDMLRMRHQLVMLVEGREFHGRRPWRATAERRVREGQRGRF